MKKHLISIAVAAALPLPRFAEGGPFEAFTAEADVDLGDYQYRLLRLSAARRVNVASDATNLNLVGVLQNNPSSQQAATVAYIGRSKVVAGAAVTAGSHLTTNGSGKAIDAGSGDMVFGRALEATNAEDEVFQALLQPPFRLA